MRADNLEVYAHRGGAGIYPESSLVAYQHAIELGVDVLDADIQVTADEVIVAYHDPYLNPDFTQDKNGNWVKQGQYLVNDLTFEELQYFSVGLIRADSDYAKHHPERYQLSNIKIPRLEQLFELLENHPKLRLQLEVKTNPFFPERTLEPAEFMALLNNLIKIYDIADRVEVHSFDWRNMLELQAINPAICTSYITSDFWVETDKKAKWQAGHKIEPTASAYVDCIKALGGKIWCPDFRDLSQEDIEYAHQQGIKVTTWTVNSDEDIRRIIDYQADGIITDYLNKVLQLLASLA